MTTSGVTSSYTYDPWGRLATRTQGSYNASYAYRYGGRLYQATSNFPNESNVTFDYGGDGKLRTRTTASETRTYRYDRGWNAVNEEVTGATVASNVFEPGAQVGSILAQMLGTLASGTPIYAYHDHLATVRQWRYTNKNLARANKYDPYGNFYSYSGYLPMPRVYALHEFDLALQQYRAPYRNYSPSMARWTTLDPLGMVDGPNMYAYAEGSPVFYIDQFGLACGPGINGDILVPEKCPGMGTTFTPCCKKHDDCYSCDPCKNQGKSRFECEADFLKCMLKKCKDDVPRDSWRQRYCIRCAWVYSAATFFGGESSFRQCSGCIDCRPDLDWEIPPPNA